MTVLMKNVGICTATVTLVTTTKDLLEHTEEVLHMRIKLIALSCK